MKTIIKKHKIEKIKGNGATIKPRRKKKVEKVEAQACAAPDCPQTCQTDSKAEQQLLLRRINEVVSDNARLNSENQVQRALMHQAGGVVDDALQRMEEILSILEVFCASNLGFDIKGYFESVDSLAYPNQLAPEVPQQQVCAAAVTRLAVMLYATLAQPERAKE